MKSFLQLVGITFLVGAIVLLLAYNFIEGNNVPVKFYETSK